MIEFVKTHALGNDFLLTASPADPRLAQRICHRNFGVGADGLISYAPRGDRFFLRIFNQDGSEAECSGNGLRCAAAYLIRSGKWSGPEIALETVSGIYRLRHIGGHEYEADMGLPSLEAEAIPFKSEQPLSRVVDFPMDVNGSIVRISACATGNPHCSLFVERIDAEEVSRLGPLLERHPAFPNRTNVEFIHVRNRAGIDVAFWERGVGVTYASGTGSCAAVVAAILNNRTDRRVTVFTRAGTLVVEWPEGGRLRLTSTAHVVAEGQFFDE